MTKFLHLSFEPTFSYVMLVTDLELKAQKARVFLLPPHSKQLFQLPTGAGCFTHILSGQRGLSNLLLSKPLAPDGPELPEPVLLVSTGSNFIIFKISKEVT